MSMWSLMSSVASYIREDDAGARETVSSFDSLRKYRYALWSLMLKDFRVRYRNMSLGILWSVINPLVMLGVLVIVFSHIHPNHHAMFFPVFLLIGLVIYNFLCLCLPPATTAIMDNASLVKKVIFPRELIPLSVVLSQLVHMGIQLLLLLCFLFLFSVPVTWSWLWALPVLVVMLAFIVGVSFACSALNVIYRDMLYVVESALKVYFWLTPIFYDLAQVKLNLPRPLYFIYLLNPMAGGVDAMRNALLRGKPPDAESFGVAVAVSLLLLVFGWWLFSRRKGQFADHI